MGVLDYIHITINYNGNATYHYGYSGADGRVPRSSTFTPQLSLTQLGLSYPVSGIDSGNYNLLSASFNQAFASVVAYNRQVPSICPNPSDVNSCDVNVFHTFGGISTSDVTDSTTLSSFQGTGNVTMGGFAGGSATGSVMPGTGGAITGTLVVGVDVQIQYYWTRIGLDKRVNGNFQRSAPGLIIAANSPVTFTYNVTNYGTATLSSIAILDDQLASGLITCPSVLAGCSSILCTGSSTAVAGQYTNNANCETFGKDNNRHLCPFDQGNYFGVLTQISLTKTTNGQRPTAGNILQGSSVTWVYTVTNTGNVVLTNVAVTDNQIASSNILCPQNTLSAGSSMVCSAAGVATSGGYTNIGTASGFYPPLTTTVTATDPSSYFGVSQQITVVKFTNDVDIRSATRPFILVGGSVTWKYSVTNTGNTALSSVAVDDNQLASTTCPSNTLAAGSSMVCSATGTANAGPYANTATAHGISSAAATIGVNAATVTSTSNSAYFGVQQSISVVKFTNGVDIRSTSQPSILLNQPVTWNFVVTNTGNSDLTNVAVVDNLQGTAACAATTLVSLSSTTCSIIGQATSSGQYRNVGTATGVSPLAATLGTAAATVTSTSPSSYFGVTGGISIVKFTNGVNVNAVGAANQPLVLVGNPVVWTYVVSNIGNSDLTAVTVVDSKSVSITCPFTTLLVSSVMTCSASGTAVANQYNNIGTATGVSPVGPQFGTSTATSASQYFGVIQTISILKYTNNVNTNAALASPPIVLVNNPVTWRFEVTNTGNKQLTGVSVTDNRVGGISCPATILGPGSAMTCFATGSASINSYTNIGTAVGTSVLNQVLTTTSPSSYFGVQPGLSLVKYTNDVDIRSATRPYVLFGNPVTWKYTVTNTGNSALSNVVVTDNRVSSGSISCPANTLAQGSSFTCVATGVAGLADYTNVGTAQGVDTGGDTVVVTSPSAYFGVSQSISIVKTTQNVDIRFNSKPYVLTGAAVTWRYTVTNTGNVILSSVAVNDNREGVSVSCPAASLAPSASFVCTATGIATPNDYANIGTATGISQASVNIGSANALVTATSPSGYFGVVQQISIVKYTNDVDVRSASTPLIPVTQSVTWKFAVTNLGNTQLTNVNVQDNRVGLALCPSSSLAPSSVFTCTATGIAAAGPYTNVGTATGFSPLDSTNFGNLVTATSPSAYFGVTRDLQITKYTNGVNTNTDPQPLVLVGGRVTWVYVVSNVGNTDLSAVSVSDDHVAEVSCPLSILAATSSMTCSAVGAGVSGQYNNVGTAFGTTPLQNQLVSTSPSSYFGVQPSITLQKFTNDLHPDSQLAGPQIESGTAVTWKYTVTNNGNVELSSVNIVDNQVGPIDCPGLPNPFAVDSTFDCFAVGTAGNQPYNNVATSFGTALGQTVTSTDISFYNPLTHPGVSIIKRTNGVWTKDSPIPHIRVGSIVTWTYEVTNTGDSQLTGISVTDDLVSASNIQCPTAPLAQSASMICSATGIAIDCLYNNVGCVSATGENSFRPPVTDCSQSSYIGMTPAISIVKFTNHFPSESVHNSPGPCVEIGEPVWWHYVVSNIGDDLLTGITVYDDQLPSLAQPVCPDTCLKPWYSMTCKAHGKATAGPYTNIATATGHPSTVGDPVVTAVDQNWHRGVHAQVRIQVNVNGEHQNCGNKHDGEGEGCSVAFDEAAGEGEGGNAASASGANGADSGDSSDSDNNNDSGEGASHSQRRHKRHKIEVQNAPRTSSSRPASRKLLGSRGGRLRGDYLWDAHKHSHGPDEECKSVGGDSFDPSAFTDQDRNDCPAPIHMFGTDISFTFVVENIGSEDLINVQLSFDGANDAGVIPYAPFNANDVHCPATVLAAQSSMTCLVLTNGGQDNTVFSESHYGRQKVSVKVNAVGECDGKCVQHRDETHWYTPGDVPKAEAPNPADNIRVFFVDQAIEVEAKTEGCCDKKEPESNSPPPHKHRRHSRSRGEGEGSS